MATTKIKITKQVFVDDNFDFNAKKITNLATPAAGTDAVTKDYADGLIAAADAMVYKGAIDCSVNPNYPAGNAGWMYKVSVSGKIGGASGQSVVAGNTILCTADSTASGDEATVGIYWNIVRSATGSGDVVGPSSATDNAVARFDATTGKLIQNSLMTVDDSGSPNIPTGQSYKINGTALTTANIADSSGYRYVTEAEKTWVGKAYVCREAPGGTKNGSNTSFTLAYTPVSGTEMVFLNGVLMNAGAGNDYTIATNTITFLTGMIPISTDVILVTYWK